MNEIFMNIFRCFRYHKVGLLVLFVHDITDIWLELAKALHYLSMRKGKRECPRWETAANAAFVIFVLCWYVFNIFHNENKSFV